MNKEMLAHTELLKFTSSIPGLYFKHLDHPDIAIRYNSTSDILDLVNTKEYLIIGSMTETNINIRLRCIDYWIKQYKENP